MGLFEKAQKPKKSSAPKPKLSLLEKVGRAAEEATNEWLTDKFYPGVIGVPDISRVERYVEDILEQVLLDRIMKSAGFEEDSWSGSRRTWRVVHRSTLYDLINGVADKYAKIVVERYIAAEQEKLGTVLPDKLRRAVDKQYEEAYELALLNKAQELAQARAEEDAEELFQKVVNKV